MKRAITLGRCPCATGPTVRELLATPSAELLRWSPAGYELRSAGPKGGRVQVITPQSLIALLRHGWTPLVPLIHPAAQ